VHEFPPETFRLILTVMLEAPFEPSEVAELAAYLCSAPASFANGSSYLLDGGWSAR
jgi:NAD(P)-dependent dehydrogenase (short-subunit alcohol dehydrogenase family)